MTVDADDAPSPRLALGVSLLLGLALRVAQLMTLGQLPYFTLLLVDARGYHERAVAILGGDWRGGGVFYQDPLYPYLLAAVYRVAGVEPMAVVGLQMLLGLGTIALTVWIAFRLAGPRAALVAGVLAATYRVFLFYESTLLKASVSTLLLTAALGLVFVALRPLALAAGGFLLGVALLTQGQVWFLLPFAAAQAWRRERARGALLLLGGFALALLPVTLFNRAAGGEWILTTAQAGQNFHTGNGPHVVDGRFRSPGFVRANPDFEELDYRARAERLAGRSLSAAETSRFWMRETWRHIRAEPCRFARNLVLKLGEVTSAYEVPDNLSLAFERRRMPVLDLPLAGFGLVAPLGLAGIALVLIRGGGRERLLALAVLAYLGGVALFFVFARYRVPVLPVLMVFAGLFVARCRTLAPVLLLAATAALVHRPVEPVGLAQAHLNLGKAWADRAGQLYREGHDAEAYRHIVEARREMTLAAAEAPGWAEPPLHLGIVLGSAGDWSAAERELREALRRDPRHVSARIVLSRVLRRRGEYAEAERLREAARAIDPAAAEAAEALSR